jgi:hypothetical protein
MVTLRIVCSSTFVRTGRTVEGRLDCTLFRTLPQTGALKPAPLERARHHPDGALELLDPRFATPRVATKTPEKQGGIAGCNVSIGTPSAH